jgi:superfamily I DNA/RNA helicase
MAGQLTSSQAEAVAHDGHLLIVAGPGSGKTSTSVAKATRILADPRRSLVMVTFTRDAADEMRKRLQAAIARAGQQMPGEDRLIVATFHSIAIKNLRRHRSSFRVLSPRDQDLFYGDAIMSAAIKRDKRNDVQHEFERYMYAIDRDQVELSEDARFIVGRYQSLVQGSGHIDLYTVMRDCALDVSGGAIPPLPYTDMLVDEGQDTDELQKLWIFSHARAGCRVTIVGDDDQSIYEWRNALGYEGMKAFLDTFRAHRIELGTNFRCRNEILGPASLLIGKNKKRLGKHLTAHRGRGGAIASFRAATPDDQNRQLADVIQAASDQHKNAAILARTNRSLDLLEMVLRGRGIEYARAGSSIWKKPIIVGYLGLLQTLVDGSPTGLLPVLQLRNVSDQTRSELLIALKGDVSPLLDGHLPEVEGADATDKKTLGEIARDCSYWRRQLRVGGSVREVILEVAQEYAKWTSRDTDKTLLDLCSRIVADLTGTLSQRLQFVQRKSRDSAEAPVTLMTMHAAKGLEFETVHIIDAAFTEGSERVNPEPERRLMYVAMTRAKNCLVVWYSDEPHPAVVDAQIPLKHSVEDLLAIVRRTGSEPAPQSAARGGRINDGAS